MEILQRIQNKALKAITNAPLIIKTSELHEHSEMKTVKEKVTHRARAYKNCIRTHSNILATTTSIMLTII